MPCNRFCFNSSGAPSYQQGFSLIEILVAFMILAMSLTVIFRIYSGGLRNVSLAQDYALAELLAESQLSVVGINAALEEGTTSGEWNDRFSWQRDIARYKAWEDNRKLSTKVQAYWVTVKVTWQHSRGDSEVSLAGIRLKPLSKKQRQT